MLSTFAQWYSCSEKLVLHLIYLGQLGVHRERVADNECNHLAVGRYLSVGDALEAEHVFGR